MDSREAKLKLLKEINAVKYILFGKTGEHGTLQTRMDMWKDICEKGKALGLLDERRDFKYMRDVCWQNLKRRALAKKTAAKRLGRKFKITAIDNMVFQILNSIEDTKSVKIELERKEEEHSEYIEEEDDEIREEHAEEIETLLIEKPTQSNISEAKEENYKVADKKELLELDFLELQNYKTKLEILELEFKLGISHSKYTKELVKNISDGGE